MLSSNVVPIFPIFEKKEEAKLMLHLEKKFELYTFPTRLIEVIRLLSFLMKLFHSLKK